MAKLTDFDKEGTFTWFAPIGLANIIGLIILMLEGSRAVQAGATAEGLAIFFPGIIFLGMYLSFHALQFYASNYSSSKAATAFEVTSKDTVQEMSIVFWIGFVFWYLLQSPLIRNIFEGGLSSTIKSVIPAMPLSSLMSSATANISNEAFALFPNVISAAFVEETFFFFGLPVALLVIFDNLELKSDVLKFGLVLAITSAAFASFHVSSPAFSAFWISAFTFSILVRGISYFDYTSNVIPGIAVFITFAIGAHLANNMVQTGGLLNFLTVLSGEPLLLLPVVGMFGIYAYWAIQGVNNYLGGGNN